MIAINNIRRMPDMKKFRERVFRGDLTSKDGLGKVNSLYTHDEIFFGITDALTLVSTVGMHSLGDDRNGLQRQRMNNTKTKLCQDWSNFFRKISEFS